MDTFVIGEAYVTINNLTHTWSSDLEMTLTHVDTGTAINFVNTAFDSSAYGGTYTSRDGEADLNIAFAAIGTGDALASESYSDTPSDPFSTFIGES